MAGGQRRHRRRVNLHHLPATLTAVVGDGSDLGARVRYSWEQPRVLGSAGGPRQALRIIGADTFLIVNGDTLTDFDLAALADAHRRVGRAGHACARAEPGARTLRRRAARRRLGRDRLRAARTGGRGLVSFRRRAGRAGRRVSIAARGPGHELDRRRVRRSDRRAAGQRARHRAQRRRSGTSAPSPTTGARPAR